MARILLVEDDALAAGLFANVLRGAGHEVLTAYTGAKALEVCSTATDPLGLVITDIVLPDMSGPAWVEKAGARLENVPVMYITGYSREARKQQGFSIDEADLLTKPVDIKQLLEAVERRI